MKSNKMLSVVLVAFALGLAKCAEAGEPTYADGVWTVPSDDAAALTNAFRRAQSGDRIVLEGGLYDLKDVGAMDTYSTLYFSVPGGSLTIAGKDGVKRDNVIIQGDRVHRIMAANKGTVTLTNLTVTGSYFTIANNGGALNNVNAYDCILSNNYGKAGGAAYGGTFRKCLFAGNVSPTTGGAMYNGSSYDCFFTNNTCQGAGGGACYGGKHTLGRFVGNTTTVYGSAPGGAVADGVCTDCSFDWNYAKNYGGAVKGGYLTNCTFGVVQRGSILGAYLTECKCAYNCTFSNAVADVPLFESSTLNRCKIINCKTDVSKQNLARGSTFMNCLFLNNKMTGGNQAVMGYNCSYYNCSFVSNRYASSASAIRTGCKAVNCIFAGGYPCDLNLNDVPTLTNCIVTAFNSGTEFPDACVDCLYVPAARAVHLFADPGAGDCHLRPGSAAKAWGLMTPDYLAKIGDLDLDGNPRLTHKGAEPALDLGCYMYTPLGMMLLVR